MRQIIVNTDIGIFPQPCNPVRHGHRSVGHLPQQTESGPHVVYVNDARHPLVVPRHHIHHVSSAQGVRQFAENQVIESEGGSLVATATNVADGTEYALDAAEFQLIGRDEDGSYLIFANQQYLKVSREDMAEVSASLGLAAVTTLPRTAN